MSSQREASDEFDCFGSRCGAVVSGPGQAGSAEDAVTLVRRALLAWHQRFSRFLPNSELSRLNADPRPTVPVSQLLARFAQAVREAGAMSGGLVDATLLRQVEDAGYASDLPDSLGLTRALALAPARRSASAAAARRWHEIEVNMAAGTATRPPGLELDSGGLAKGLFADVLGETLATHGSFAINCAGDLLVGGSAGVTRPVRVQSPFDERVLHTFVLARSGVATSGIGRRSWLGRDGRPAHHLLDPASGRPAFTGIVQVTALAHTALAAEVKAKAALLSGPGAAAGWLGEGGVIVFDDGSHQVIAPPPVVTLRELSPHRRASAAAQAGAPATDPGAVAA
ncbi:MAG TPA: FAD:protein FMN transferase [Solirubrobacteraceae bacterium]|jgi:thiamine biosynthesis lipoprotein|nr:FAD:protein FMN transferase [Solirubrobacteraceae bacterium]